VIRAVADTNVYVSAIAFGGTCEEVLVLARAGLVDLYVSPHILSELRVVLGRTFDWPPARVREALAEVATLAALVRPAHRLQGVTSHEQDHRILECALAAGADFLVTGDKRHLQRFKTFQGIRIVSPRAFLNALSSGT
jgi:putative PIN family toxin of toxin-antitoxin system